MVVFLTACSDFDTFHAAKETGALAYVLKPRNVQGPRAGHQFSSERHGVRFTRCRIETSAIRRIRAYNGCRIWLKRLPVETLECR